MEVNKSYIKINQRLQRIKDYGLKPVTLKAPSDITQKFIYQAGTGNEGLIMSYREASFMAQNERNEQLSIEDYNKSIEIFMREYGKQTYLQGAIDEAYRIADKTIEFIDLNSNFFENLSFDVHKMNKKDVVKMLQWAGEQMNELKNQMGKEYRYGNSPELFLSFVEQWYEENMKG